jgi:exonuclease VII small subunit
MTDKPVETMSFEEAMAALEQVVGALERGWSSPSRSMSGGPR